VKSSVEQRTIEVSIELFSYSFYEKKSNRPPIKCEERISYKVSFTYDSSLAITLFDEETVKFDKKLPLSGILFQLNKINHEGIINNLYKEINSN
jgi:hypothetical protein